MRKSGSLIAILIAVAVSCVWSFFETQRLMDASDNMVGMHPLVIFAIPGGFLLMLLCLAMSAARKSWPCALLAIAPLILLSAPIFFSYNLSIAGWSNAVQEHSSENRAAVESTDFSSAVLSEIPYKDDPRMVPVAGFKWPSETTAADNGVFQGFVVDGVPHIYIAPLRNGCRGVAWLDDASSIQNSASVTYIYSGTANWYIWTFSAGHAG